MRRQQLSLRGCGGERRARDITHMHTRDETRYIDVGVDVVGVYVVSGCSLSLSVSAVLGIGQGGHVRYGVVVSHLHLRGVRYRRRQDVALVGER